MMGVTKGSRIGSRMLPASWYFSSYQRSGDWAYNCGDAVDSELHVGNGLDPG